jgi:hypothetical protein
MRIRLQNSVLILPTVAGVRGGSKQKICRSKPRYHSVEFRQHYGTKYGIYRCSLVTKFGRPQVELTPTTVKKFLNPTHECRRQAVNELGTAGLLFQQAAVTE